MNGTGEWYDYYDQDPVTFFNWRHNTLNIEPNEPGTSCSKMFHYGSNDERSGLADGPCKSVTGDECYYKVSSTRIVSRTNITDSDWKRNKNTVWRLFDWFFLLCASSRHWNQKQREWYCSDVYITVRTTDVCVLITIMLKDELLLLFVFNSFVTGLCTLSTYSWQANTVSIFLYVLLFE